MPKSLALIQAACACLAAVGMVIAEEHTAAAVWVAVAWLALIAATLTEIRDGD